MDTVLRITAPASNLDELARVVPAIEPHGAVGPVEARPRGDGYVIVLCDQPSWEPHADAIVRFFEGNRDALALARAAGATLAVDVAVATDDLRDVPYLSVTAWEDVMDALAAVGARFIVSMYVETADDAG